MALTLVQHTLFDHGPQSIKNYLDNCPNLQTWHTTLKRQWLLSSIVKGNDMLELKSLLEYDDFWSKFNLQESFELAWKHPHIWTCLLPLLPSLTTFFGPCNGLLKNGLCFLNQDWCQTSTYFCGMLTTLGHGMAPTRSYKRCQQRQNFTRHNRNQNGGYGGKIISLIFDICNNMSINLGFFTHCKAMAFPNLSIVKKIILLPKTQKKLPRVGPNLFFAKCLSISSPFLFHSVHSNQSC